MQRNEIAEEKNVKSWKKEKRWRGRKKKKKKKTRKETGRKGDEKRLNVSVSACTSSWEGKWHHRARQHLTRGRSVQMTDTVPSAHRNSIYSIFYPSIREKRLTHLQILAFVLKHQHSVLIYHCLGRHFFNNQFPHWRKINVHRHRRKSSIAKFRVSAK